jgi:hypothetical protein
MLAGHPVIGRPRIARKRSAVAAVSPIMAGLFYPQGRSRS